ncbi:hypothetical protein [Microlunatus ginsengisoli]
MTRAMVRRRSASPGRVELLDVEFAPPPDPAVAMRRIAAEALILQDEAEAVLADVARGEHLGRVAPRGGPLVRRFFALADAVPPAVACPDPADRRTADTLRTILTHHAMQVSTALDFLAVAWRSERLADHVRRISGLGEPALILERLYRDLIHRDG